MVRTFRRACCSILFLVGAAIASPAGAQGFPDRTVRIVTGYPTGSTTDKMARMMASHLSARYGWSVIVDNHAGASGNMGAAMVARAVPDGYTVLLTADNPITTNVHLFNNLGFDPKKDLRPITIAAANIIALAAAAEFAPNTLPELLALAKAKPGHISFGSSGVGSPHHLAGELLKAKANVDLRHVAYKGGGPALVDLAGGHIPVAFVSLSGALPLAKNNRIKLLAITEASRYGEIPDTPTIAETLPGYAISSWVGFFAPGGTPDAIVDRLNTAMAAALKDDGFRKELLAIGLVPVGNSVREAEATVHSDTALRGELVRTSGAKLD
ncbi:MAG: tripartite tricarboxylate transporter substrate binding protein [Burkholderiaceae bacterium]|nr:tripartite tricarboxylate transporter substrate binding protein [Burkholderiaceae bacterium]